MKIALVTAGNLWFLPFVRIYTNYLDDLGVDYDIISWNRDGKDKKEGIQYSKRQELSASFISKFFYFIKYASFVKNTIKKNKYDKLIIFNPQIAVFLTSVLKKYNKRYIFDYRDLSIEQNPIFASRFKTVLANSYAIFISSPGFKKALPKGFTYNICHNFDYDQVTKAIKKPIEKNEWQTDGIIEILTIGGIRDYESNVDVIKALANKDGFQLNFVGKGVAADDLAKYCSINNVKNVQFSGYYPKEDEPKYVINSTFLNIFYPRKISHDTALSNRFYNSLIYKKPMIVTKDTTQGDFVENYELGVSIKSCENLVHELNQFMKKDYNEYTKRCNHLLQIFLDEQDAFRNKLKDFIFKF